MIRRYYELAKPGLVFGNLITVLGGFALGVLAMHVVTIDLRLLTATLAGIAFVMASGCVFNNYIDRDIDSAMARTKNRSTVTGTISAAGAIAFGSVLGIAGFLLLALFTNAWTVGAALFGFFFYVVMYSLWWKRRSPLGTLVGSIAGAVPPVVGYCAVTNRLDLIAFVLFLILVLWQMPHFFSIAIRRNEDYKAAGIPVLPVAKGSARAKTQMLLYIIAFTIVAPLLTIIGGLSYVYFTIAWLLGLTWLIWCLQGLELLDSKEETQWAKGMFFISVSVLMLLFISISIEGLLLR